jgi:hypothetical protein
MQGCGGCRGEIEGPGSVVDIPAVTNPEHQNDPNRLLNGANDPVVAYSITPEAPEFPYQRLASSPRVVEFSNFIVHVIEDASLPGPVNSGKLFLG